MTQSPTQDLGDGEELSEAPGGIDPPSGWRYVPGLDGIRALAVLAVLAFHAGVPGIGGGLLGVDIFFVLSGFLITSLLVSEFAASGTLRFGAFYARRARRLLPALALTLAGVALFAWLVADPGTRATIRGDALATIAYVANWRFVITDQNYFVHFGVPSPLLHTWSLAVEEQFYLVWPALALFVLRRRGANGLLVVALVLAVASLIDGVVLFHTGASSPRLYYGTDLRVQEVMVGASLAAWWGGTQGKGHRRHRTTAPSVHPRARGALQVASVLALAALAWMLHAVDGSGGFLYQGGFLLVGIATAVIIATVVKIPDGPVAGLFSLRPLRYIGRISYGLYLYHWPIFLALNEPRTGIGGVALLTLRFAATFAAAILSYHFIEEPIRRHHGLKGGQLLVLAPATALVLVVLMVACTQSVPGTTQGNAAAGLHLPHGPLYVPPASAISAGRHVKVIVFGDSMAATLAHGLGADAGAWGVDLEDQAQVGCDLLGASLVRFSGGPPAPRPTYCAGWRKTWATIVATENPDVVVIGVGRWEILDREVDGTWYSISDAALQHMIASALDDAVRIAAASGAHVVLTTLPYVRGTGVNLDGSPLDLNQPWRTDAYNKIVREVAAKYPASVTVVDVNRLLDPNGVYTDFIDGVRVRYTDEEHPTPEAGMLLRPKILPILYSVGQVHRTARGG